jgi:hypothetical protein
MALKHHKSKIKMENVGLSVDFHWTLWKSSRPLIYLMYAGLGCSSNSSMISGGFSAFLHLCTGNTYMPLHDHLYSGVNIIYSVVQTGERTTDRGTNSTPNIKRLCNGEYRPGQLYILSCHFQQYSAISWRPVCMSDEYASDNVNRKRF